MPTTLAGAAISAAPPLITPHLLDVTHRFQFRERLVESWEYWFRALPGVAVWRNHMGATVPGNALRVVLNELINGGARLDYDFRVTTHKRQAGLEDTPMRMLEHALATGALRREVLDNLTDYQVDAIRHFLSIGGGHAHAPTGSGKSWMLAVCNATWQGPVIAVAPTHSSWQLGEEVTTLTGEEVFELRPESRLRKKDERLIEYLARCESADQRPYVLCPWSLLRDNVESLIELVFKKHAGPPVVAFDESQFAAQDKRDKHKRVIRRDGTREWDSTPLPSRSRAAFTLAKAARHRLTFTATPVPTRLTDLWGQLTLVEPNGWGKTSTKFKWRHGDVQTGEWGHELGDGVKFVEELRERLSYTRVLVPHSEVAKQMKPKRRRMVRISREEQLKSVHKAIKAEIKEALADVKVGRKGAANQLREAMLAESSWRKRPAAITRILEHVNGAGAKVLVFSGRRVDCEELGRQLGKRLPPKAAMWVSHGGDSREARKEIQHEYWNHDGPAVLIGTWNAWGTGLNLHCTNVLMWVMLPSTPEVAIQGEGRVQRLGMKHGVLVEWLFAEGTYDEHLRDLLLPRLPVVEAVADGSALEGLHKQLRGLDDPEKLAEDFMAWLNKVSDTEAEEQAGER